MGHRGLARLRFSRTVSTDTCPSCSYHRDPGKRAAHRSPRTLDSDCSARCPPPSQLVPVDGQMDRQPLDRQSRSRKSQGRNLLLGPVSQTGRNGSGCPGGRGPGQATRRATLPEESCSFGVGRATEGGQCRGSCLQGTRGTPRCVLYTQVRGRTRDSVIFPGAWHFHWVSTSP